ncbi:DUF1254 domain-containing protein [Flammeovirga sp. SubArs3]|uniref:DUF1254 domain-containing protein n=1 Tax=Flammeovirga sp. SubArs3 TaxID=2995316 RepID=UPI00248C018F|nr:DUF1254 domain-containing protein [Flammeovirga sp. SubArs3]
MKKIIFSTLLLSSSLLANAQYKMSTDIPESVITPDKIETSEGELNFFDGVPSKETVETAYNFMDKSRAYTAFMDGMKYASIWSLYKGHYKMGNTTANSTLIFDGMMDSKSLFLTANTSTMYVTGFVDTKRDGVVVIEIPDGALGFVNDMSFNYICDLGMIGRDKGKGGKYAILPVGYEGEIPEGCFPVYSKSHINWVLLRMNGDQKTIDNVIAKYRSYPASQPELRDDMNFIHATGKEMNTIHSNNIEFYNEINEMVQYESTSTFDAEILGTFRSIGIEKGVEFNPDKRMVGILNEAVALGNASARSIVWYPRREGVNLYEDDPNSSWRMGFADRDVFFNDQGAVKKEARDMFHYPYTGITPAMAMQIAGKGSDYGISYVAKDGVAYDGSKTYVLHIDADVPTARFWAVTLYDTQTRSMIQTNQVHPSLDSNKKDLVYNEDGSIDIYFSPEPIEGKEGNWLQTIPGKSWFTIFRNYGPEQEWIDGKWRLNEIEEISTLDIGK